ncbi:MAG: Holliday junction resolvase RuvX [Candidatus Planktophila sp.]|jgi:putative holliday junction resolvase|tara:strand:- start:2026 stop:2448 length:423 start_codon:yes stop_codon:yes gene_type:complete
MSRVGRRVAFDYGDVRIGVAVCDPDGILATPLATLQRKDPKLKSQISLLLQEYEPVKIYVGRPKLLSGEDGSATAKVEEFTVFLTTNFDIPIVWVDERLSTVGAQRQLYEAGKSAQESKALIDAAAAVAILEQGLANESR